MIFQFKINLKNVGMPVWRRLLIENDTTFEDLHYILLTAFDWEDVHLHDFVVKKTNGEKPFSEIRIGQQDEVDDEEIDSLWGPISYFDDMASHSQTEERLSDWFVQEKDRVLYTYDFGDDWEHDIVLEKILERDPSVDYPICVKAKNNTPPEDSRFELKSGEIDLTNPDAKGIVETINLFL